MPVSPDYAANLAKALRELYVDAEEQLLSRIAASLARGLDAPDWAQRQLQQLTAIRTNTERLIARLTEKAGDALYSALFAAYSQGVATAGTDLTALGESIGIAFGGVDTQAVEALVIRSQGIQADLAQAGLKIVSSAPRRYRDVVERVTGRMLAGAVSRREAAASAVKDLASSGITRFADTAGRSWELGSYAEMTTRTAAGQAMVQGHTDRLQSSGRDLVMVSDAPEECKLCRPWEGKVLSLGGTPRGHQLIDGHDVIVAGTLREATSDGLFHPNCRHRTVVYVPGRTRPLTDTADPDGDRLRQQQRYRERRVRELKRRVAALEPLGATDELRKAKATLRAYSAEFKAWREDNDRKNLAYRTNITSR